MLTKEIENKEQLGLDFANETMLEIEIKNNDVTEPPPISLASKEIEKVFTIKVEGSSGQYCGQCPYRGFHHEADICRFFFNYTCLKEKSTGRMLRCIPCKSQSYFGD